MLSKTALLNGRSLLLTLSVTVSMALLRAQVGEAALVCTTAVPAVPILDPLGLSAELGELVLTCGGAATDPIVTTDIQSFFNVPLVTTVMPILTDGTTDYTGTITAPNSVRFFGVSVNPIGTVLRMGGVLVNPSLQPEGFQYVELVTTLPAASLPISNPQQILALNGTIPDQSVPEPLTGTLLASGLACLVGSRALRSRLGSCPPGQSPNRATPPRSQGSGPDPERIERPRSSRFT